MSESEEYEDDIFIYLDLNIKNYIKRLLMLCGYDDINKLENIDESKLKQIEEYLQDRFGGCELLRDRKELRKYFGNSVISCEEIKTFKFNLGARESILIDIPKAIANYKNQSTTSKEIKPKPEQSVKKEDVDEENLPNVQEESNYDSYEIINEVVNTDETSQEPLFTNLNEDSDGEFSGPTYSVVQLQPQIKRKQEPSTAPIRKRTKLEEEPTESPDEETFNQILEKKRESFFLSCNNFLKKKFEGNDTFVEEVDIQLGPDGQVAKAAAICPFCDPINYVKCSIDRKRKQHRITIGNFICHIYNVHVQKSQKRARKKKSKVSEHVEAVEILEVDLLSASESDQ